MDRLQQIEVDRLLLARETLFARVHSIEESIDEILGGPYPLPDPPKLRSMTRKKGKAPRKQTTKAKAAAKPPTIRTLNDDETGYRVTYRSDGREVSEIHADTAVPRKLLGVESDALILMTIATVDANAQVVDVLWARADDPVAKSPN